MFKKNTWFTILGFIFLTIICYVVWLILAFFVKVLSTVDPNISVSILGGMVTIFGTLAAVIFTQNQTKIRDREAAHISTKVKVYKRFLKTVALSLSKDNESVSLKSPSEQELVNYLVHFQTEILLWGSPEVIKMFSEFIIESGKETKRSLLSVDNLYRAIRSDIGLSNKTLNNYDLVKMHLKDPNELDQTD